MDSSPPSLQETPLCSEVSGGRISAANFPQGTLFLEVPHVMGLVNPMHTLAQHFLVDKLTVVYILVPCSLHLEFPEKEEA